MGQAKRRRGGVGQCIYCGSRDELTDEHVLPYGLGGQLVLPQSSCKACSVITGRLEQSLLRGHWWPYRKKLGLQSRNPKASNELKPVKIMKAAGKVIDAMMPLDSFVAAIVFKLEPPAIISGASVEGEPVASEVYLKMIGESPSEAFVDGEKELLSITDKVEYPINFDVGALTRFLAKVSHGYAISKEGLAAFEELYLPKFILGETDGILTYVGGYKSALITDVLPGGGYNRMSERVRNDLFSVCIQMFIDKGEPPPIYEVVVGKKRSPSQ